MGWFICISALRNQKATTATGSVVANASSRKKGIDASSVNTIARTAPIRLASAGPIRKANVVMTWPEAKMAPIDAGSWPNRLRKYKFMNGMTKPAPQPTNDAGITSLASNRQSRACNWARQSRLGPGCGRMRIAASTGTASRASIAATTRPNSRPRRSLPSQP